MAYDIGMLPVSLSKRPDLVPAAAESEIRAFLRAESDASRRPTLRDLHKRFHGSYTRLTRIRRASEAELAPAAAAPAPANEVLAAIAELGERIEGLQGTLAKPHAAPNYAGALGRIEDQLATLQESRRKPWAREESVHPDLSGLESRMADQEQLMRDLVEMLRKEPVDASSAGTTVDAAAAIADIARRIGSIATVQVAMMQALKGTRQRRTHKGRPAGEKKRSTAARRHRGIASKRRPTRSRKQPRNKRSTPLKVRRHTRRKSAIRKDQHPRVRNKRLAKKRGAPARRSPSIARKRRPARFKPRKISRLKFRRRRARGRAGG